MKTQTPELKDDEISKLEIQRIERLAVLSCRLHYDQTSLVFEKLGDLLVYGSKTQIEEKSNYLIASLKIKSAKKDIDDAWKNCLSYMADCETKHSRIIKGYDSMENVAIDVYKSGYLKYFLNAGVNELMKQSSRDKELNHPKLSNCLRRAAYSLDEAVDELSQNY